MWLALALCWLQGGAEKPPEARIDFYSVSNASVDVELEIEAEAFPKDRQAGAKPRRVSRFLTWNAGGSDNSELARLVSEALAQAGFDATSEGAETILRDAVELSVHTKNWTAVGAQVWGLVPKGAKGLALAWVFEPRGKVGKAACSISSSAKSAAPKPVEGDDLASARFPAPPPAAKPPDGKPANPKEKPKPAAKPSAGKDPKAKGPVTELKVGIAEGSDASAARGAILDAAKEVGWKLDAAGAALRSEAAPDGGAPLWAAIRFVGNGEARIGVRISRAP